MNTGPGLPRTRELLRLPLWLGFCLFLAIAMFFLWEEHRAHFLGAAPYALLVLCPFLHFFMHRGHGADHGEGSHTGHRHDGESR